MILGFDERPLAAPFIGLLGTGNWRGRDEVKGIEINLCE
jgi:hypothetical protein